MGKGGKGEGDVWDFLSVLGALAGVRLMPKGRPPKKKRDERPNSLGARGVLIPPKVRAHRRGGEKSRTRRLEVGVVGRIVANVGGVAFWTWINLPTVSRKQFQGSSNGEKGRSWLLKAPSRKILHDQFRKRKLLKGWGGCSRGGGGEGRCEKGFCLVEK